MEVVASECDTEICNMGGLDGRIEHVGQPHSHQLGEQYSTCSRVINVVAAVLPPKLYLVVFYQVSLVNQTRITCSNFRRPSEVLLGSACCTISHVHTPWGNCNKCSSMIVSIKDSVS